ncbi:MAG: hypothetical protein AB8B91_01835, partial [Rubripirellula sp.]
MNHYRSFLVVVFAFALSLSGGSAFAQQADTGNADAAGALPGAALDADAAFSNVERGDTIGATGSTGASFSAASSSNGGGGGGGFGGLGGGGGF